MPARFRELSPYSGVDENLAGGNAAGIVVALKGSNTVKLVDGAGLKVVCSDKKMTMVELAEITDQHQRAMANQRIPTAGSYRVFKIIAKGVPGIDKVKVEAFNISTGKLEATLKVLVLRERPVTISLRPTQVSNSQNKPVDFYSGPLDMQALIDEANKIWKPQANVVFALGKTGTVMLPGLTPGSTGANIEDADLLKELKKLKDGNNFTAFFVTKALHGSKPVKAVTDVEAGVALIGDDRSERTLAHEAGHFLGSHTAKGKYERVYGHQGTDKELLMPEGAPGRKIPYGQVTDFNNGYTAKP